MFPLLFLSHKTVKTVYLDLLAGVLNYVPPTDRDASELLREVDRTCLNPDQKIRKQWKVHSVHMVSAASSVETRYRYVTVLFRL